MSFWGLAQLVISTVIFLLAATAAKQWGLAPSLGKIVLTLALYSIGNLTVSYTHLTLPTIYSV